nr:BlaI/MecI/CopY family transcriptional regulator [Haliscomenobacter sp.]
MSGVRMAKKSGTPPRWKLLQIMVEKGLAQRNTDNRTHVYEAAYAQDEVQRNLLQRLADSAFEGSAMQMVMQVLGNHDASTEELDEVKALIEKVEEVEELRLPNDSSYVTG